MTKFLLTFVTSIVLLNSCHLISNKGGSDGKKDSGLYLIETDFGDMKIKLYDETPLHKANFDSLVSQKYYDGMLFHRIMQNFMVQGGDPNSKTATPGQSLGTGGPGYTIPAEFVDTLIHKKGVLAAARQGDQVNPTKESSGSQFYIVQGKTISTAELAQMEAMVNNAKRQQLGYDLFNAPENKDIKDQVVYHQSLRNTDSVTYYANKIEVLLKDTFPKVKFSYSEKAKTAYSTVGGTPQLDGGYTVFGEVIEGLDVLDSLAKVKVDPKNRPLVDLKMTIKKL
ncbi:MAG: cyclophilin family peptidyl-prolyl cis-trans isomerase [Glaciecola sp.]|jgi:cyclophilin family peptidyl-prolyl cis-trans isomerase